MGLQMEMGLQRGWQIGWAQAKCQQVVILQRAQALDDWPQLLPGAKVSPPLGGSEESIKLMIYLAPNNFILLLDFRAIQK